ncbi:polysaccharide pyruvyl transferase family protein [Rhodanobacter sp. A1T4]|jgi:polysaccharide pyruvyl transferase WcaK-like protein|uniref:polysaccharide pyruvyl transferase family protein n=1 Tax=Rhodanobacter sp. A1T4 TaxID=2723087 RepID=UPI001620137B|nr:polysaccharide pyruvyl transferase family protein [Rhodanobacter sp. A1T4]MBB6247562.1 polysaccharide pyruvyl transferase WcaK-like protein [Rhodanobacter sp. A1T4]
MKNVIFTGYYGMKNYGDDLFGVVSTYGARTWWPQFSPTILGPRITGQTERFSVPTFISADQYASDDKAGKLIRTLFSTKELLSGGKFVFSGGSLFSSNRSRIMDMAERISRLSGKKFSAIGVSIGPFDSRASEDAVVSFLRRFEYISVRDQASYALLQSYQLDARIAVGRDLAGLAPALAGPMEKTASETKVIGYAPCNIGGKPEITRRIDDLFVATVSKQRNVRVKIFSLNSHAIHGDTERSQHVSERLKAAGVAVERIEYAERGVIGTWRDIATCDAVVSVRLHGAITAYLCGVPFILFEYHKKCSDFLDDIGQPGAIRVRTDDAALANELAGDFEHKLLQLFTDQSAPKLSPTQYAEESTRHFTGAPWVSQHQSVDASATRPES